MSSVTSCACNALGNRSAMTHANGIQVSYVYDDLNRLTDLGHQNSGGVTLKSYAYTLLPNGKRSKIEEANGGTSDYQYDDLYRLTSESIFDPVNASHNASYTYDKVGNRTFEEVNGVSTAYTYNNNDCLLQTGGTTYTHDANGNTESQTLDSVVTTYTYNAKNEFIGSDEAGLATTYQYNADGIRVGKVDASGQTRYTTDSNRAYAQVLTEHLDGTEQVRYTYGDDLISQKRGTETSTYYYDGLGSTRALSDSTGTITNEYDYDAFGEVLNQSGTTENDYLFTGEQFDATLDQYYLRARYYDPAIGRFTQMDTWMGVSSDPITLHKYLYTNVDPANMVDPSGRFGISSFGASSNIAGTLSSIAVGAGRISNVVGAVETTVSLYNARSAIFRIGSYIRTGGFESTLTADEGFANAMVNFDEGLSVLGANVGKIFSKLAKSDKVKQFVSNKKNNLIIYAPTPESKYPWFRTGTRIPIGNINVGKNRRKIYIGLGSGGSQGGRFTDIGHTQGQGKRGRHTQWFRVDWHKPDGKEHWRSGSYHFHLNNKK